MSSCGWDDISESLSLQNIPIQDSSGLADSIMSSGRVSHLHVPNYSVRCPIWINRMGYVLVDLCPDMIATPSTLDKSSSTCLANAGGRSLVARSAHRSDDYIRSSVA
jgi:hypothetical protein